MKRGVTLLVLDMSLYAIENSVYHEQRALGIALCSGYALFVMC